MTWTHLAPGDISPGVVWLVTGTPIGEQYPCRCHEARYGRCHPAFCPCAGRPDPVDPACCANRFRPADVALAAAEWREKRERERSHGSD